MIISVMNPRRNERLLQLLSCLETTHPLLKSPAQIYPNHTTTYQTNQYNSRLPPQLEREIQLPRSRCELIPQIARHTLPVLPRREADDVLLHQQRGDEAQFAESEVLAHAAVAAWKRIRKIGSTVGKIGGWNRKGGTREGCPFTLSEGRKGPFVLDHFPSAVPPLGDEFLGLLEACFDCLLLSDRP